MLLIEKLLAKPIIEEVSREKLPECVLCRVSYPICDIGDKNANGRVYEDAVWDKVHEEKDLKDKLENRALFGHAEHPEQTQSNLEKTSHVIFEMWKDGGQEWQKLDVLDTPTGRIVDSLLRAGCRVGMSTRAEGDLEEAEDDEGNAYQRVIPESYNYVTTDFTADPSTFGAIPHDIKRNVVSEVKKLLESKEVDESEKEFASCLLESMKCDDESKCQNCGRCKALKENKQYIMEGVWALPNTAARAKKLAELMKKSLSSKEAVDKLGSLLGDDALWDSFKYKDDEPRTDDDVRPKVKKRIKQYLKDYEKDPGDFKGRKLNDEAKKILKGIVEQKVMENLITDGTIKVGTEIKYGDDVGKVSKIEEGILTIEVENGVNIRTTGVEKAVIMNDGVIELLPEVEVQPEDEPIEQLPPGEEPTITDPGNTGLGMPAVTGEEEHEFEAKKQPGAKVRHRGDVVFPAGSSKVTDDKDHFPINDADQARNALARANQYDAAPKWYKGSLTSLVKKVASAVKAKFPSIEVTKAAEKPGKESIEVGATVTIGEQKVKDDWAVFITKPMKKRVSTWLPELKAKEFAKLLIGVKTSKAMSKEDAEKKGFDVKESIEGKITKIEETGITIALDDGTTVSIEDPTAVNITVTAPAPAEEIEPELPPEEEVEDMEAAGPLPIEKDVPESKVAEMRYTVQENPESGWDVWDVKKDEHVETWEKEENAKANADSMNKNIREGVDDKLAAGNLLQDKEGASWTVKEVVGTGLTVNQPGEPGTEKFIEWNKVSDFGFTKVSEVKVEEATSVQKGDEWFVESPSGKDLGGPYKSKIEADKRKKDVEFYAASKESKVEEDKESFEHWITDNSRELYHDYSRYNDQCQAEDSYPMRFREWAKEEFESGEDESEVGEAKGEFKNESKVDEGFKTDLENKDKAAVSKKISAITDKLLAGETLSRAEKHYWSDYGDAVKANESIESTESISTTAKEITNLRVQEASTRAERDKAIELLEEIADGEKQLEEKVRKEKAFEAKILVNKIGKTLEAKELEVDAIRAKLEEKAKLAADLKGQLEEKSELAVKAQEMLDEIKTNLSNDIKSLNESVSVAEDKHQKDLSEAESKHQKKLNKLTESMEEKIKEAKEETEEKTKEEVTKEFVKCFVEVKLSETDLKVDENSRALLENCKSIEEVDDVLDEITDAVRRGALHSDAITGVHVVKRKVVDPEYEKADRRVGDVMKGFGF